MALLAHSRRIAFRPSAHGTALFLLALALGLPSLAFPFGHDQGLYFYVGREWLHGACPYRDVFDHKTPGIYVVHLVSIALFGEHTWAIRIADLSCVLVLGLIVARLATPRARRLAPGIAGFACATISLLHYGYFNYWDTAQSELWYTTLGLASVAAAARMIILRRAAVLAGVAAGLALAMKPPSMPYVLVAFAVLAMRAVSAQSGVASASARPSILAILGVTARFALAAACPLALTALYFAARGGLSAMIDIVVGANSYYVAHEKGVQSLEEASARFRDAFRILFPLSAVAAVALVVGLLQAVRKRDPVARGCWGLALAIVVASVACVSMQQKFYWLHWLTVIGGLGIVVTLAADRFVAFLAPRIGRRHAWATAALTLALVYAVSSIAKDTFGAQTSSVIGLLSGRISRPAFASRFFLDPLYYYEVDVEATSAFIRSRARPGDTLCARGFNPELYALTGLKYEGRFFWTNFLVDPRRAYRRQDYLEEDRKAFLQSRPRFVVAVKKEEGKGNIESAETYFPLGYTIIREFGTMQVLERGAEGTP